MTTLETVEDINAAADEFLGDYRNSHTAEENADIIRVVNKIIDSTNDPDEMMAMMMSIPVPIPKKTVADLMEEEGQEEMISKIQATADNIRDLVDKKSKYKIRIEYVDLAFEVLEADQYHRYDAFISAKDFEAIFNRLHEFEHMVPAGMYARVKRGKPNTLRTFLNHILEYSDAEIIPCYTNPSDRKPAYYRLVFAQH